MGTETKIQWTDHTFNHVVGCEKVSEGCKNCYAEVSPPARKSRAAGVELWGPKGVRQEMSDAYWEQPAQWAAKARKEGRRHKVFCASLADWLDPKIPARVTARLLQQIWQTEAYLDWQLLTKRPEQFGWIIAAARSFFAEIGNVSCACWLDDWLAGKPPSNVWVGCSAENQERLEERVPHLLRIPAKVRFLSCEPLLEPLLLPDVSDLNTGIHWVIVGGESGPKARPCNWVWIQLLIDQCREAKVPVFVKQFGANVIGPDYSPVQLRDPKGGDMDEWPETLRVREFPMMKGGEVL